MLRNKQHPGLQGRRLWDSQAISWQQAPYVLQKQTTLLFLSVKMQHSIFLDFITTAVNFLLFPPIFLLLSKFTFQEKKKPKPKKQTLDPYRTGFHFQIPALAHVLSYTSPENDLKIRSNPTPCHL